MSSDQSLPRLSGSKYDEPDGWVRGICPACKSHRTLFVGNGGYLTCSLVGCPDPCAAHDLLNVGGQGGS